MLFSTYGPVLDVVALRTTKMRGQAHVVFRDAQTATHAMRALQGFEFFGKEMVRVPSLLSYRAIIMKSINLAFVANPVCQIEI